MLATSTLGQWSGEARKQMKGEEYYSRFSLALNVTLANIGNVNTFRREELGSVVNLTFVSDSLVKCLHWHVSEEYTHSDQQAIYITIEKGP